MRVALAGDVVFGVSFLWVQTQLPAQDVEEQNMCYDSRQDPRLISSRSMNTFLHDPEMPDLLVNLLKLPPLEPAMVAAKARRILIRRAQPFEISNVRSFIEKSFAVGWADEISVGFCE